VNKKSATPKDAAAVILIRDNKVLWAQRNPKIPFLGGWHAFPGGKSDAQDSDINVKNCANSDRELEKFIVCAAREIFEEVGVLLARGGEKLTKGQRASLHDDLISGRSTFAEILDDWDLHIDARDFFYTGFWTTPQFSPVRFKTRFFIVRCPPKQEPYAAITEMQAPEFIEPAEALRRWTDSEVLISPPVLISLQELADSADLPDALNLESTTSNLLQKSQKCDGNIDYIELNPRLICLPLKTETLPPATHTNCFIVGKKEFVVIDAASKEPDEQRKLFDLIDSFVEKGSVCRQIIVSHLHRDHFGGEIALQKHLREKFGLEIPIAAHETTAEILRGEIEIGDFIEDNEQIELKDKAGESFFITALHTPGHARGHLCFYDSEKGFLLSSDNVVGAGTVVVAPPEGDMKDYLNSLERMKNLPGLKFLCGSHGAAVFNARGKIEEYIAHRLDRERQVLKAFQNGAKTAAEIAENVYQNLDEKLFKLAEKTVEAHLEKLRAENLIAF
jgi:glyoxylase-like metal-dependent hydrolase (beta-lactamase superfamily II)/8-oxo-dGTP pyrophosphatase MutT (NUDIX family)